MAKKKPQSPISIKTEWVRVPGDGTPCEICRDQIYGNMYALQTTVFTKVEISVTKFCESCYTEIDNP